MSTHTYVTNLVGHTRERRTEGRRGDLRELDGDLQGTPVHKSAIYVRGAFASCDTHNSPGTLHAELDAERACRERAEARREDPQWDERCRFRTTQVSTHAFVPPR